MPDVDEDTTQEPLRVSILRHGGHLVASFHSALDDGQLLRFRKELLDQIGRYRAQGVIIDVAALDVLDSFACHTLRALAQVARLRGAETVVVGIQPGVAFAMARLGTHPSPRAHRTRPRGGARPPRSPRRPGGRRPPDMVSSDPPGCARTTLRRSPGSSSTGTRPPSPRPTSSAGAPWKVASACSTSCRSTTRSSSTHGLASRGRRNSPRRPPPFSSRSSRRSTWRSAR